MDKIIYLSFFLNEDTPAYGGEKGSILFDRIKSIAKGDTSNNLKLTFPNHIGTHIDFPFHFDLNGKKSNDYPADFWVFNNVGFIQCNVDLIEEHLHSLPTDIDFLILKTGFGLQRNEEIYWKEQPVIKSNLANVFRSKFPKLRLFGFDMISLTSKLDRPEGKQAHLSFLIDNNILILEDMNLENLISTPKKVIVSPLQIKESDGTPCTVFAFLE
jgi:kynurenine formamidase